LAEDLDLADSYELDPDVDPYPVGDPDLDANLPGTISGDTGGESYPALNLDPKRPTEDISDPYLMIIMMFT
jgi:hypothetical protein